MGTAAKTSPSIDAQSALAAQAALAGNGQAEPSSSGVDKMRELLFGNQMQDYDKRFSILEERFQLRMRDLEAESSRGLSSLETTIKKQLESVAGQFREEKDLRSDGDKELELRARAQGDGRIRVRSAQARDRRADALPLRPHASPGFREEATRQRRFAGAFLRRRRRAQGSRRTRARSAGTSASTVSSDV